jgi:hypothetical protein
MRKKGISFLLVLVLFSFSLSGCYCFSAKKEMKNAQNVLEELKGVGGPTKAPYEYCSAEKFLEISRMEFAENDFKHAQGFASRSKVAAEAGSAVGGLTIRVLYDFKWLQDQPIIRMILVSHYFSTVL